MGAMWRDDLGTMQWGTPQAHRLNRLNRNLFRNHQRSWGSGQTGWMTSMVNLLQ